MMYRYLYPLLAVLFILAGAVAPTAQDNKAGQGTQKADESEKAELKEQITETEHEVVIEGTQVEYTALAGTMPLKEDIKEPKAEIFFIAYTRKGIDNQAERPITFSFNGGPGSSSVWLHLGLLGPRRVLMRDDGSMPPPPYELVDNEYSLLDKTDLVFIDPVSTGFSRTLPEEDPKQFHGVNQDIRSVGEFIRLYLTKYDRWSSPKFLIGESYGTTRAAGLADYLQDRHGMYVNGIMLVSSILQFQTTRFEPSNDLPFVLFLPTYTATAWYHEQLDDDLQADLQEALRQSEAFAENEYATALLKGDDLPEAEYDEILSRLARFTGLSEEYVRQANGRVVMWRFAKELLRDERRTTGRLDSRFTGIDVDAAGESYEYDPSYAAIYGPYSTLLNDYVNRELQFESELPYEILTGKVWPWKLTEEHESGYVNVAERLRQAMTRNPYLKVFVASGYYDLATPYFATEYTFNHLQLDPSLQGNITMAYYESGHMMYIRKESLAKMKGDLAGFLNRAVLEE